MNRRTVLAVAALIGAAIIVPPFINISRFKPRIAVELSRSFGRQVSIGDIHLKLFPTPGLNMERVVVEDDPAFSQEPLLRADEVTASLRLTSLWRGRLEIARLSFTSPSLNLVRRADGHWNLESLLERARRTPVAPTAKRTPGERLRFPYIESDAGRVNLKFGAEKTVYALTDADFALWLEQEDEWNLRLTARPIRTDANLNDTGKVKLSGTLRRAGSLTETPVDLHITLDSAQLGQLTTLMYGRDRGWRGSVNASAALRGMPSALKIQAEASVDDFRRYDIATVGNTRLASSCSAAFSTTTQQLDDIRCESPVGDGVLEVRGNVTGLLPVEAYQLSVTARELPAAAVAALVRHMKKDLPEDVSAAGAVSAQFAVERSGNGEPAWSGMGRITDFTLRSSRLAEPLALGEVQFGLPQPAASVKMVKGHPMVPPIAEDTLVIEPVTVDLGGASPAHAQASFSESSYRIAVTGDTGLKRLFQISEALGVAAPRFSPDGTANVDLSIAGEWAGFAQPLVVGTAKVKATVPVNGIGTPVQITSATLRLSPDGVNVDDLSFGWPKSGVVASGAIQLPRHCTTIETCPVKFQLRSDSIAVEDINALLNPETQKRPWYAFISSSAAKNPVLARVSASGTIAVTNLKARAFTAKNIAANVSLVSGLLIASNVTGSGLGGKLSGTLRANFVAEPATFAAQGKLEGASVAALSGPLKQSWGTGKLDAAFTLTAAGLDVEALKRTAAGDIQYNWRDGTVALALDGGAGPLRIRGFRGIATLQDGKLSFAPSRMETAGGIYTVSGTASLDRQLGLTLARGNTPAYEIRGTLEKPKVTPSLPVLPQTQAQLHP